MKGLIFELDSFNIYNGRPSDRRRDRFKQMCIHKMNQFVDCKKYKLLRAQKEVELKICKTFQTVLLALLIAIA